ncbi:tyrosine-type recombinase/integrase [Parvicella tangerina]|uniref:Tyrosine recombinase XerC n=1 Tax=Parvicella tangerina TaxID=2829795 RepID=A0A916JM70_9FLAO|nr:tyrosine-type recombinase/integrase [Parvicella tangerina]CAG5081243.1 Tyrosine recombinase XerC [Parvicella tangerina]
MALKGQKTKSDYMEWDTMQTLILKLERDGEYKFAALIASGCFLGLRISDLLQLKWSDLIGQTSLTVKEKKTKKDRTLTINPQLVEIMERIYSVLEPNPEELIFVNRFGTKPISVQYVNSKLKELFTQYNIKGQYSSHFMRKTLGRRVWAMNEYSEQALIMLSYLFGHSSIQTTKTYLGIREQEISNLYLSV